MKCNLFLVKLTAGRRRRLEVPTDPNPTRSQKALLVKACPTYNRKISINGKWNGAQLILVRSSILEGYIWFRIKSVFCTIYKSQNSYLHEHSGWNDASQQYRRLFHICVCTLLFSWCVDVRDRLKNRETAATFSFAPWKMTIPKKQNNAQICVKSVVVMPLQLIHD